MSSPISKTAPDSATWSAGFAATFSSSPENHPEPRRVGRDGSLSLGFERRGARTVLARSRFTLPLQAQRAVTLEDGGAYAMVLNPTGGVLGGDVLTTHIELAAGAHACLTTPSATRVYRTSHRPAVQETHIELAEGAALEFLPDHVIPSAGASFRQHLRVNLAPGARAIIFDSFAAGRIAHGERWTFRDFDSRTEILLEGRPLYLNHTLIEPFRRSPAEFFALDDFNYVASVILIADDFQDWPRLFPALAAVLDSLPAIYGGASLLAHTGCVVRFLARTASDLVETNAALWKAARPLLLGQPAFDLRKY